MVVPLAALGSPPYAGAVLIAAATALAIHWDPIPFSARRRRETAAYSARHYGRRTARLRHPHVIVEHYTANDSYRATWNTFAADVPDAELHELPGTCAHFVIDRSGRIHQLVRLRWRCRHTVGLNWTAIGIEHVGTSDAAVLDRPRVLRASLWLTHRLRCRYGIRVRNVIGHAESLSSPYHHERVARLRTQTHADMSHPAMVRYRRKLARMPCP
jgi:N-acetylmuramoyl-L-alanine amidase